MEIKNIHFIGINGSGIVGVACVAKDRGYNVTGCDTNPKGAYSEQLLQLGINIEDGHNEFHITDSTDLVVLTPAVLYKDRYKNIPEIVKAFREKKVLRWQEFLGTYIMKNKNIIAVTGTHGKSTTTTFLSLLLEKANFDPTSIVGGIVKEWKQTYRVGKSDWYIIEADEYAGNFMYYNPKYIILNNIEMEHPEYFKTFNEYKENFKNFLKTIQNNGKIIFNYDDKNSLTVIKDLKDFFKEKNIELLAITFDKERRSNFCKLCYVESNGLNKYEIDNENFYLNNVFGEHIIRDLSIASVLAKNIGISIEYIKDLLKTFSGCGRRMDLVCQKDNLVLYDDYGHHHTQIKYTLEALRNKVNDDLIYMIFEPHLISRFEQNSDKYLKYLQIADRAIITKFYKSREYFRDDLDMNKYLNNIETIDYIEDFDNIMKDLNIFIKNNKNKNIYILVMGAGNSYKITESIKIFYFDI